MLLTLTALLSCATMASAKGDKLTDLAASIQKQEEFLIYDIRGDLSSDDVLAAFSGFNVPYKFMSLSGRRFFIVVMKDSSDHTQYASLSFPGASQVDVYLAEHLGDFYEYAGAENLHDKTVITFPDDNLILTEFTILDRGADVSAFKQDVAALGDEYENHNNDGKLRGFHVTATFPVKLFVLQSFPSYVLDRMLLEGDIVFKGPYQTEAVTTPIANM